MLRPQLRIYLNNLIQEFFKSFPDPKWVSACDGDSAPFRLEFTLHDDIDVIYKSVDSFYKRCAYPAKPKLVFANFSHTSRSNFYSFNSFKYSGSITTDFHESLNLGKEFVTSKSKTLYENEITPSMENILKLWAYEKLVSNQRPFDDVFISSRYRNAEKIEERIMDLIRAEINDYVAFHSLTLRANPDFESTGKMGLDLDTLKDMNTLPLVYIDKIFNFNMKDDILLK